MTKDQAIKIATEVGQPQGWDLFDYDATGRLQVQRCDEAGILETDLHADQLARAAGLPLDEDGFLIVEAERPHPKCPKCGSEEFQIVEDVPRAFRSHAWGEDGALVFSPDSQEMCWDGCGGIYQYLECRGCQTRMTDIPFNFETAEGADTGCDEQTGEQIVIVCEGGLVQDVYSTNGQLDVEVLDLDDIECGGDEAEIAEAQAEELRVSERHAAVIADQKFTCVF